MRILPIGASLAVAAALLAPAVAVSAAPTAAPTAAPAVAAVDAVRTPASPAYTVSLTSNASGGTWTGRETVTFINAAATPLAEVYLRLWDNAHGTCSAPPITVTKVTGGKAGALTVACTAMKVTLPAPLAPNGRATIGFDLKIVVPNGVDRFGRDGSTFFLGNALPVLAVRDAKGWHLDPYSNNGESFYAVASDFDVTLNHPTALSVPATGISVDTPAGGGRVSTRATAKSVREFAWAIGPLTKLSGTSGGGVKVNIYSVGGISGPSQRSMLNTATAALDAHSQRFGAYPYSEADIVINNNFWFGGMEYPGFILNRVNSTALAHELAHQWWYGIVGNDEYNDPWLDEGFTDYATDLYFDKTGAGCAVTWQSPAEKLTNSMAYWDGHTGRYGTVIYGYGKCTLHDLRRLIGDAKMATLLKSYAQAHWYGVSTVAAFKAAAQQAAGSTSLEAFWTQHRVEG
jgi:hypothetical protein